MKEVIIKKEFSNQRCDKFVRKYLNDAPLSFIYKLFRKKDVKVNKHWVKENYILNENDVLQIYISDDQLAEFNKPKEIMKVDEKLDIVYEDKNILIVDKKEGILVHGDSSEKRITLANKVLNYLYNKDEYNPNEKGFVPGPVHRLDRNTSGLVIFAKNIIASQELMEIFKNHDEIKKTYIALVCGNLKNDGEINIPLYKDEEKGIVKVDFNNKFAKEAITRYKVLYHDDKYSLVKINLLTGRTHQIRVSFSYIKHPVVGDKKYGNFEVNKKFENKFKFDKQFLHAYSIEFGKLEGELSYLSNKKFCVKINGKKEEILNYLSINTNNFDI